MVSAAEVVEALPEGVSRTLHTANSLHYVRVRLQSLGPGFCSTRVMFGDRVFNLAAHPLSWSDWYRLEPPVAGVSIAISISATCDGQVVGEVKYNK